MIKHEPCHIARAKLHYVNIKSVNHQFTYLFYACCLCHFDARQCIWRHHGSNKDV